MKKEILTELPMKNEKIIDWKKTKGMDVDVLYNKKIYTIHIIDYLKNYKIKFEYNNDIYYMGIGHFKKCQFSKVFNIISSDFRYNKYEIINNMKILDCIKEKSQRCYKYKCLKCGYIGTMLEINLLKYNNCPVCCNPPRIIVKGINDIATTHPEMVEYFVNIEDAYKYSYGSGKKVWLRCPNCGYKKEIRLNNFSKKGFNCPKCEDGISYPEKIMLNVLEQLNIKYIYQLTKTNLNWCEKYRYDFYFKIDNEEYIIETHGEQHYKENSNWKSTLKNTQQNDLNKYNLAIKNGIKPENYIIIDCRQSELEFIKNSILNSRLNYIFDLNSVDWEEIKKCSTSSNVLIACELYNENMLIKDIAKKMNININTVREYLIKGTELNICNYCLHDVFKRSNTGKKAKKVKCLNTSIVYKTAIEAKNDTNATLSGISKCCNNKQQYSGTDPITGEHLKWCFV